MKKLANKGGEKWVYELSLSFLDAIQIDPTRCGLLARRGEGSMLCGERV